MTTKKAADRQALEDAIMQWFQKYTVLRTINGMPTKEVSFGQFVSRREAASLLADLWESW